MSDWLDRIGLLLQFLAFWLVAPEILGQTGLLRLRTILVRIIRILVLVPVGIGIILIAGSLLFRELAEHLHSWHRYLGLAVVLVLVLVLSLVWLRNDRLRILIDELEDDEKFRRRLLSIGLGCLSVGFLFQFIATF